MSGAGEARRDDGIGKAERLQLLREGAAFAETLRRASSSAEELEPWIARAQADIRDARDRSRAPGRAGAIARRELVYKPVLLDRLRRIAAARRAREGRPERQGERGFTLSEMLVTIAILGVLIAIAIIIWLGILEARRVDAATNQLKADMRLAHTSAVNQLTDWRVVLVPDNADEDDGPDYHLVKLAAPYPGAPPVVTVTRPRTFPANVKIVNIAGALDAGPWAVEPSRPGRTRTAEFNPDDTMRFYGGVSGSTCVTADGEPENRLTVTAATSRVGVRPGAC